MKFTADVSALGAFTSASLLVIDKDTSVALGPVATPMTTAAKIAFDLKGYPLESSGWTPDPAVRNRDKCN